jgi:hypothetical protein
MVVFFTEIVKNKSQIVKLTNDESRSIVGLKRSSSIGGQAATVNKNIEISGINSRKDVVFEVENHSLVLWFNRLARVERISEEMMNIKFRQTGGFAGLTKAIEIDTTKIPPNEAEVLKLMLDRASFFEMSVPSPGAMPDREQYTLSVESEGRSRQLQLGASNLPAQLRELVDYLSKQAQYEKR